MRWYKKSKINLRGTTVDNVLFLQHSVICLIIELKCNMQAVSFALGILVLNTKNTLFLGRDTTFEELLLVCLQRGIVQVASF